MDLPADLVSIGTSPWDERPTELPLVVEEVRTALWTNQGNINDAAKLLKVSSQRLRRFVSNNEYLKRELEESKEVLKDIAEANVYEALTDSVDAGRRDSMSRFVLSSIGKDRGYGAGGSGVNINTGTSKGRLTVT